MQEWPEPRSTNDLDLFLRPELHDSDKEFGRYHALDLYTILATMTEEEWRYALELRDRYRDQPYVVQAGDLVFEYFSALGSMGMIRMRESHYYRPELQLDGFMEALQELFPATANTE